ncbi:hypothetical protein K435DRAFT_845087 [Dendrothele bispora CBS 962.96]|uniref:Uncharacterized protein n=1 Tax=Dendrothele bispora (strain CBS 962.96) TaxID=1314807 RepID=A0A4S8KY56_DENBC|nr:hypothetical protein K435DRAFT_845087 [Dendrothele bispora CBS 962.96]
MKSKWVIVCARQVQGRKPSHLRTVSTFAFSNGPTCVEIQCEWITKCIKHMVDNNLTCIEAELEAEKDWHRQVWETSNYGPWMKVRGWYNDGNIPGKPLQPLNYAGGVATYATYCTEKAQKGYEGFALSTKLETGQTVASGGKAEDEAQPPPIEDAALVVCTSFTTIVNSATVSKSLTPLLTLAACGARVDSDVPNYEFSLPEIWRDWTWKEKFPDWRELRKYFDYVDSKLDVRKHIRFNTKVVGAKWDEETHQWEVEAEGHSDAAAASPTMMRVRTKFLGLHFVIG